MNNELDVIVLNNLGGGQSCQVDRLPMPGETVKGYNWTPSIDSGKGPNTCIALGRLGVRAAFIGKCGKDPAGDRGEKWMKEAGVDTSALLRTDEVMTGQGIRIVAKNGGNTIVCGESSSRALTVAEVEREMDRLGKAKYFYGGFEIRSELTLAGLRKAKAMGITTITNYSPIPADFHGTRDCCDYVIVNETEAAAVCGLASWRDLPIPELLQKTKDTLGCGCVIITLGGDGSTGLDGKRRWRMNAVPVACVDTSGAGDAFLAGFAANLVWGKDEIEACRWAGLYASYTTQFKGTLPSYPLLPEAKAFVEAHLPEIRAEVETL